MAEKRVVIQHKDGREYQVTLADFRRKKMRGGQTYEEQGFKIATYADGSPYEEPRRVATDEKPATAEKAKP